LWGRPLAELRAQAKRELLLGARQYTNYRNVSYVSALDESSPVVMAGHQPELFHPGVWFKSFVLSALAQRLSGNAVNLLIDNDAARNLSIKVPGGTPQAPVVHMVPLDHPAEEIPYEEREVLDQDCFATFGTRAADAIAPLVAKPLLGELWPLAQEAAQRTGNLGRSLAEARHRFEERCGLQTLEVPLSQVCQSASFTWFAAEMLCHAPSLHQIYNSSLADYRRVNRVRSRSHPVPDLATDHGYLEAPFWMWTRDDPRRRRVFVQMHRERLEITDRDKVRIDMPLSRDADERRVWLRLRELHSEWIKVRPRALVTTMFARLFLADLFVHGIGGGKYDELTDAIITRLFDLTPPAFLTATATIRLPIARLGETPTDLRRIDQTLRELQFHPERFIPLPLASQQQLIQNKRDWISRETLPAERAARHRAIEDVNLALQASIERQRLELTREREQASSRLRTAAVLGSREYAFCLFPRETLVETLGRLAAAN
jgi:hypothetical protein